MSSFISILLAGLLTENVILSRLLGICPFLNGSKKVPAAASMGVAVTVVMIIASVITYPLYAYILVPCGLTYLQTIVFILIIVAIVQLLGIAMKRFCTTLYSALGNSLSLITTNCAVLGVTILNFTKELTFLESLMNALSAGLGFLLALVIFAGVREKLDEADIPEGLKGLPITLIAAAIISLSFLGFAGIGG